MGFIELGAGILAGEDVVGLGAELLIGIHP
jgi:hypothetical protein